MNDFKRIESVSFDPSDLLLAVERHSDLWKEVTTRQLYPGTAHVDTETIFLRWCESQNVDAAFNDLEAVDYPALEKLPEVKPLFQKLGAAVKGEVLGRIILVNLIPGGFIRPHVDEGSYADHYERFHMVLKSDPGNVFYVGEPHSHGEFVHMKPGEAWWFNHKRKHWLVNESDRPRLHLIVDMVAPEYRRERDGVPA